jgi:predicted Zn-dependent peptidase
LPQQGERRVSILAAAEPELLIGFHKTAQADPDDAVFDVLAGILGQGQSSRLYRRLVVEKQLATSVTVFDAPGNRYPNLLVFHLTPRAPHTLAELEQAVYQELGRLSTEPVTTEELTRVRNRVLFQEAQGSNSNTGLARLLMDFDTSTGSWRSLGSYQKAITGVTAEDITRIANRYLKEENRIVGTLVTRKP